MNYSTEKSRDLFQRAEGVLVEGGSSPSRGPANYGDYPIFIERGEGGHLYDVDGNKYVDWMMGYGALPLGHAHPRIVHALNVGAPRGTLVAAATETEIQVAELICQLVPSAEKVRFANTGTEAAMAAIRLARGYSGRPKFVKFEGHYHGWHDDFLVNAHPHDPVSLGHRNDPIKIAESSGLNRRALEDTVVVPWNDLPALERALETHRGQIAAIICEPIMANMGVIPPERTYLGAVQQLARDDGILLIVDETVTGFRIAPGGAQQYYNLDPDISIFGKALGAGLPVAAFAGKAEIMEALAWGGVLHYGTQNASRVGLYASRAFLREAGEDDDFFRHTWTLGEMLTDGIREVLKVTGTEAIVQAVGPMFQIMFTERDEIHDYREFCEHVDREKFRRFAHALFRHGVYLSPSAALHSVTSAAHTEADVSFTLDAVKKAILDVEN
ncbi:MAG: aspartate aminotransferase family protein [Gemmatimonadetes bacterium]|uniref:Glutamate-1-semialdehyde 2,1-aminomutase n=1 Tax=Candidatus Kutchimonas denitrificans TaxID=3056748 RepID=A0AAE4ZCC6_9BACT|nr:aspartate aminotransferase family protein [Gemmatimonadota bacterium]NIR75040.1 aspartate aminotransferase family protein [Candidatus Kutchimonas denitrificans]NIS02860.1 aspartate aminotransferase family protein [Gemmatimonadota bacterium]NIT68565.1 aspartate aminotransferase family protein [Gemmatimonadota bacterium]NIU52810.1 aminotransferase class III-fold pyridoxal phosphate-dependent enzyme [Gemmatimonadota bacterium]